MFLKQTYQHSKWLFAVFLCAITIQAFINYKHGAVVSPFYHYGMYSGVVKVKESYRITLLEINGRIARGQDYSMQLWDKIYLPLSYYFTADSINSSIIQIRNKVYTRLQLNTLKEKNQPFINTSISPTEFMNWYAHYLQQVIGYPIRSLAIKTAEVKSAAYRISIDTDSAKVILPVWYSVHSIETR